MTVATSEFLTGLPGDALRLALWQRYADLLESGVPSDQILVLTNARNTWDRWLRTHRDPTGAQRVATPLGFAQLALRLWWPLLDARLTALGFAPEPGNPAVAAEPLFVAVDLAQHLLGRFTRALEDEDGNLVRPTLLPVRMQRLQVLDALGRGVEGGVALGDGASPAEALASAIARRLSVCHTPEQQQAGVAEQVEAAIAKYVTQMLRWRLFDHALQLWVFTEVLCQDPAYLRHLAQTTTHIVVEDLDELSSRWLFWLQARQIAGTTLIASLKSDLAAPLDEQPAAFRGGLRAYMGANPQLAWKMAENQSGTLHRVDEPASAHPLADCGRSLTQGLYGNPRPVQAAVLPRVKARMDAYGVHEMIEAVLEDLASLLVGKAAVAPNRVAIVVPALSPMLIWALRTRLNKLGVPLYVFAGTNRLTDHRSVRLLLTVTRLCRPAWVSEPSRFEILELMEAITGQNLLKLGRLAEVFYRDGGLVAPEDLPDELGAVAIARYRHLWGFLTTNRHHDAATEALAPFFRQAFSAVWTRLTREVLPETASETDFSRSDEAFAREVSQIGQLIDLAQRFDELDERLYGPVSPEAEKSRGVRFLAFLNDEPIAERPYFQREPHSGSVMLATASQLAEKGFAEPAESLDHLFMLDFSSPRWMKSDRKELVNARVLAADWDGPYTRDRDEADQVEKLAKVLMACCCKVTESLWIYACQTDETGRENDGDLPNLLVTALHRDETASLRA